MLNVVMLNVVEPSFKYSFFHSIVGNSKNLFKPFFFLEPNRCLSFNSIKIFERFERMAETAAKT